MTSLMNRLMVAAAAMVAVAGVASAQTMKAEVPFSFVVSGKVMPAGAYRVSAVQSSTGNTVFRIFNLDRNEPVLATSQSAQEGAGSYTDSKLVFRCSAGDCSLAEIWTGSSSGAHSLYVSHSKRMEAALITIQATRAD